MRPRSVLAAGMYAPISRSSFTVSSGNTWRPSGTCAILRAAITYGGIAAMLVPPRKLMVPDVSRTRPEDRAKGGAFTRSVGAQQANRLALADGNTDIADRRNGSGRRAANTRERQHAPFSRCRHVRITGAEVGADDVLVRDDVSGVPSAIFCP